MRDHFPILLEVKIQSATGFVLDVISSQAIFTTLLSIVKLTAKDKSHLEDDLQIDANDVSIIRFPNFTQESLYGPEERALVLRVY